jgi:hypothetical protein
MADSVATSVFPHYAVIWDIPMGALFFLCTPACNL